MITQQIFQKCTFRYELDSEEEKQALIQKFGVPTDEFKMKDGRICLKYYKGTSSPIIEANL